MRTFSDRQNPPPGFVDDLVAHSAPSSRGSFVQTLVLTDVATGWTECAPLLVREQNVLREVLTELRKFLPFNLLGIHSLNVMLIWPCQSACKIGSAILPADGRATSARSHFAKTKWKFSSFRPAPCD